MKTNPKSFWRRAILFHVALMVFFSCTTQEIDESQSPQALAETETLAYIKALGFLGSIEEHDDFYLVEGDIRFPKKRQQKADNGKVGQAYHPNGLVSAGEITDITVAVDASIPTSGNGNWRTEVQQAITDYNGIDASIVHLVYVTGSTADIVIQSDAGSLDPGTIASGEFPSSGIPGSTILINVDFDGGNVPTGRKRYNMVHELGHNIGLRHTNWASRGESSPNHIQGTPCTDASSVMNGGTANNSWNGFSLYDIIACQMLYPISRPQFSEALLRYFRSSTGNHFYTTNFGELYCGSNGYVSEGFEGFVFTTQVSGTVALHRFYSVNLDDHFYTTVNNAYSNYVHETIAGYVYATNVAGTTPVYRYYNSATGDHFYTRTPGNYSGYVSEGVGWYSIP